MPVMLRPVLVLCAFAAACAAPHPELHGLDRSKTEGPYLAHELESFALDADEGAASQLVWSASAGELSASGARFSWRLPGEGTARVTLSYRDAAGAARERSWDFDVVTPERNAEQASQALLAAPVVLLDGGTATTGSFCTLEYDGASNVHLAYREDDHPSLYYGKWNGSAWTIELVDGMGFNTGGLVGQRFAMVLDGSNVPHFAYQLEGKGLYYATRVGNSWVRERVDSTTRLASSSSSTVRMSIALDPVNGNRPVVAYSEYGSGTSFFERTAIAVRSGGTWTQTLVNLSLSSTSTETLLGDILFDAMGRLYVPFGNRVAQVNGTTSNGWVSLSGSTGSWMNAAWSASNTLLYRFRDSENELAPAATFSSSVPVNSRVEVSGANVGDLAFRGKPYMLHVHGSNLELVTTDANNYWTYTQLGPATGSQPAIAVSAANQVSICYQYNNRIMFQ